MLKIASFVSGYVLSVKIKNCKENSGERLVIQTIHGTFPREKYYVGKIDVLCREVSKQTEQLHIEYIKNKFISQGV